MNDKILIKGEEVSKDLDGLRKINNDLNDIFVNICKETNKIPDFWGGEVGSLAFERLNKYEENFVGFVDDLNNKITFLENVISIYEESDKNIERLSETKLSDGGYNG